MLKLENLTISFGGVSAVKDISLEIKHGEMVGVIGPNGAGKTTLLRLMTGLLNPDRGRVHFEGHDVSRKTLDQRARMGLVMTHQIVRPFRQMTLLENVTLAAGHVQTRQPWLALWRTKTRQAQERGLQELQRVGISDAANKPAHQVPLGYLKRLQVAMALALDPKFLMLDEPLAGLNYHEAERFSNFLTELHQQGLGMLLVEHNLGEVLRVVKRLVVIDAGKVLADGEPSTVMVLPQVRRAYLGDTSA